jgi:GNAT superfamily N-acetyltransferase
MDANAVEYPVQQQLEAYNARDIDAFMAWWADDGLYYEFPSRLLASGSAEIRARHVTRFQEPNLFGSLITRIVAADIVVDHEIVTRTIPDGPGEIDVVAIYEVKHGKIAKAWFKMGTPRLHAAAATTLRLATIDDADAIRWLTREAYAKWVPVIGREPMPMTVDYREALGTHRIDLLYVGTTLAALIETVAEPDHLLIENVAVSPGFQGRGFGRTLLSHAEHLARDRGYVEIRLYTNRLFTSNVRLYLGLGYTIDRQEDFMGGVTIYMSKRL